LNINFSQHATSQLLELSSQYPHLHSFIIEVLQQDPRPAYKKLKTDNKIYAMHLSDFNIKWQCTLQSILVLSIDLI